MLLFFRFKWIFTCLWRNFLNLALSGSRSIVRGYQKVSIVANANHTYFKLY